MTLMKSNTTRRSQPITRSRLRNPTSKSITTVLWPRSASPAAKAAAVVVFPTPPLPDVIATTFANKSSLPLAAPVLVILQSPNLCAQPPSRSWTSIPCHGQLVINKSDLHRRTVLFRRQLLADEIAPGNADQLGFEAGAKDSRLDVATGAGQRAAAQRAIDMNVAVGDQLGARADCCGDDEVGAAGIDLCPRPHRLGNQTRRRSGRLSGRLGVCGRRGCAPARLCRIWRKAREARRGGGNKLFRMRVLDTDEGERVAAQHFADVQELVLAGEPFGILQIEHDRSVEEKSRAAPDLLLQLKGEGGIPQDSRANHHHGEKRPLNEIARHTKTGAIGEMLDRHGLAPNSPCRNEFWGKVYGRSPPVIKRSRKPGSLPNRRHHQPDEPVARRRVDPAQHRNDIVFGIDPGQVAAGAAGEIAAGGSARIQATISVQPPEIAVLRVERTGLAHALDPGRGEDPPVSQHAAAQQHQPDTGLVAGMDEDPAAPMRTAGYRLHPLARDLDIGVTVAMPFPIGGGADRLHDELAEDLRQRSSPEPQQRQAQPIYADIVIFPEISGRLQVAMRPLLAGGCASADAAVAIDQIRLAPQLSFPFRGLLQQVMPGDRVIVRRVEPAIVNGAAYRFVEVADPAAIEGEPRQDRQVALRDAEGQVDLPGVAPLGDNSAVAEDETVGAAARPHRPERLVPWRLLAKIT